MSSCWYNKQHSGGLLHGSASCFHCSSMALSNRKLAARVSSRSHSRNASMQRLRSKPRPSRRPMAACSSSVKCTATAPGGRPACREASVNFVPNGSVQAGDKSFFGQHLQLRLRRTRELMNAWFPETCTATAASSAPPPGHPMQTNATHAGAKYHDNSSECLQISMPGTTL